MNPLQRTLIEKTGNDNGFEHVVASDVNCVTLASARHANRALVGLDSNIYHVRFETGSLSLLAELLRSFPAMAVKAEDAFRVNSEAGLAALLQRASSLSRALPCQAATDYHQAVDKELAKLSEGVAGTEVERMVRQRVGQHKFREAMLNYWGASCAVTGVTIPEVLRASHAKPWAECRTDSERLDVFNGFLLSANLDALFDRFLISFDECGSLILSSKLEGTDLNPLGIWPNMKLRWVSQHHLPYLSFHRSQLTRY